MDFHLHSYYSDGSFAPAEVLQRCKDRGLEMIALTDHDNVDGVAEAKEAGEKLGVKVIPGIEFSTGFQEQEYHLLGYFIDYQSPKLGEFLKARRESRIIQIEKIIQNLGQIGFEVSLEQVMAYVRGSPDRYHISLALFPDIEKSAVEAEKRKSFFRKFLLEKSIGGEGLAFAERDKPDIQSTINLIQSLGGMAFWAHPFWAIKKNSVIEELILTFRKMGLDGIEVGYSHHNQEQTLLLHKIAQDLLMYESAGSDFHREDGSMRQIANFQTFGLKLNFPSKKKGSG